MVLIFRSTQLRDNDDHDHAYAEQTGPILLLQRPAQGGVCAGIWTRAADQVPVPRPKDALAVLDLQDRDHQKFTGPEHELTTAIINDSVRKRPLIRYDILPNTDRFRRNDGQECF